VRMSAAQLASEAANLEAERAQRRAASIRLWISVACAAVGIALLCWTFQQVRSAGPVCDTTTTTSHGDVDSDPEGNSTEQIVRHCDAVAFGDFRYAMPALAGLALLAPLFLHLIPPGSSLSGPGGVGFKREAEAKEQVKSLETSTTSEFAAYSQVRPPAPRS
jgi:hypothetical protein